MISPLAHIDPSAKIGNNVTVYPFAFIDANVEIGDDTVIMPYASIMNGTTIGRNNKIYQGAIIGADPQDFRWKGGASKCCIGNNNVIREQVIINRGFNAPEGTRVGDDSFIMAGTHIGHDTWVKGKCVIGNAVTIAGNTVIGECTILSSAAVVHENCNVGDWAMVKGGCRIGSNVPPYAIIAHNPASYFGINAWVMRKKGFTDAQIDDVAKCYRHIYQSGSSVFSALKRIEADVDDSPVRQAILDFIRDNNLKIVATNVDIED